MGFVVDGEEWIGYVVIWFGDEEYGCCGDFVGFGYVVEGGGVFVFCEYCVGGYVV